MVSVDNIRVVRVAFKALKPPWTTFKAGVSLGEMLAAGASPVLLKYRAQQGTLEFDHPAVIAAVDEWRAAQPRQERKKRGPKKRHPIRPCLRCHTPFPSLGIHNRLCLDCHHYAAQATGYNRSGPS